MRRVPELPEIETVRRVVCPQITGAKIVSVAVGREKIVGHPSTEDFIRKLEGRTVVSDDRKGKALVIILDRGRLIIRFGMTGQLIVVPEGYPPEKHTHVTLRLEDGREVWYIDPRMFGKVWYIDEDEEDTYSGIGRLGLEPDDPEMDWRFLKGKLGKRSLTIKEALLDQSVVAGIGNIWSDEILFRCKVCPETPCSSLSDAKWKLLAKTIPEVMEFGIEKNAITPAEYLEGKGRKYYDIYYLEAYGHEGDPCPRCGKEMVRTVIGGRSSYWCPRCQRKPRCRD